MPRSLRLRVLVLQAARLPDGANRRAVLPPFSLRLERVALCHTPPDGIAVLVTP